MAFVNENFLKLPGSYLFAEIAKRRSKFIAENPDKKLISLGIGDVTRPLPKACIDAMHAAVDEMGDISTFQGYPPYEGYDFLLNAIAENDYKKRGIKVELDEIFVSDGAKSDSANIQEIFGLDSIIAVTDPVYPVYVDSNAMSGRTGNFGTNGMWDRIEYLPCHAGNGFVPELPKQKVDLIYLCLPNNPTGMTLTKAQLKDWVDYARNNDAIILFDSAYEAFITEADVPRSIYEIEGAREVAIELRSYSKTAGFTGTRCAYTIIPKELTVKAKDGSKHNVNKLWLRRQSTKFNGVSYIIQKGAAAIYTEDGQKQITETIKYYMDNAKIIREGIKNLGIEVFGGVNAPYIWLKTPNGMDSWEFFDKLINEANIVGTPGSGFGPSGQGYFRLTAFGSQESTIEAVERFKTRLKI